MPQKFNVVAPQFSLDPKLINSYYPPDGHQDEARVLPHIVFNDPHLPWERDAGFSIHGEFDQDRVSDEMPTMDPVTGLPAIDSSGMAIIRPETSGKSHLITDSNGDKVFRSMVPWLAVLVFDPEELKLEATDAQALKIPAWVAPHADITDMTAKMSPNGTFPMSISGYLGLDIKSRINYEANYGDLTSNEWLGLKTSPDPMTAIFPRKSLFKELFKNQDPPSNPNDPPKPRASHNIESFKYMAHVREINTIGFPDAGVEANGLYSIIISTRTGNFNITQPKTQICHLVSIENIDTTYDNVKDFGPNDRIGMVSLHSWIYTALPPNAVNFVCHNPLLPGGITLTCSGRYDDKTHED